jgi:hypothetical protein
MGSTTDRLRATWLRPGSYDLYLRVSDADRAAVADLLARHYGEGRLDQAEFDERVTRAMAAKTGGDFQGLLDDLPDLADAPSDTTGEATPPVPPAGCHAARWHRRRSPVLPGLVVLVLIVATWNHMAYWGAQPWPWLIILAAAVFALLVAKKGRR